MQNYATYQFCSLAETARSETKTKTKTPTPKTKTKTKTGVKTLSDSLEAKQCLETVLKQDSVSRLNITE
jgi:hypothetical protein